MLLKKKKKECGHSHRLKTHSEWVSVAGDEIWAVCAGDENQEGV